MHNTPLDILPLWSLFLAAVAFLLLALEGGYRLGRWRHNRSPDEKEQPVGAMVASILGLLALVLGFTFSMAASRFDAKRQAVLEEANAIGTTYLRARLLPEPAQSEITDLLREYVDVRIQGVRQGKLEESIVRSAEIHESLWARTKVVAEQDPHSIITGVFIQSLNDLIDMHAKRMLVGVQGRIPLVIWVGLFELSMLGVAAIGYQCGLSATRRSPAMVGLVLAFAVVMSLIADLDRGQEGFLQVGQHAMTELQQSMQPIQP
ncbi:MAG: hypothetical protein AB7O62_11275 [Pirellulales bacterium]